MELRLLDPGREAITEALKEQFVHGNISVVQDPYCYPVLNGKGIEESLIREYPVYNGTSVILCSDGYPMVCATLEESERVLKELLSEDPLLIGNNKLNFMSTKGCKPDEESFDDRAWVRIGC